MVVFTKYIILLFKKLIWYLNIHKFKTFYLQVLCCLPVTLLIILSFCYSEIKVFACFFNKTKKIKKLRINN
jgi:hypothetical protein